jgi:16S rRNA U1498 N3-methylase RsmE
VVFVAAALRSRSARSSLETVHWTVSLAFGQTHLTLRADTAALAALAVWQSAVGDGR